MDSYLGIDQVQGEEKTLHLRERRLSMRRTFQAGSRAFRAFGLSVRPRSACGRAASSVPPWTHEGRRERFHFNHAGQRPTETLGRCPELARGEL